MPGRLSCLVLSCDIPNERDHLVAGGRVETRGGLVKVKNSWSSDKLRGHTDSSLLTTGNALLKRSAYQCLALAAQSKGLNKLQSSVACFMSSYRAVFPLDLVYCSIAYRTPSYRGRARRAANISVSSTVKLPMSVSSCSTNEDTALCVGSGCSSPLMSTWPRTVAVCLCASV